MYRGADKFLARPGRKQAKVSVRMAWVSFGALPCREKKNLMTARVSMLLKSRASLTCFRACFLPGRAKDLSAPRVKGPPCCKVIRTVKEKIKRQSIYPVIFVTNLTTCYLPKRQASSFQDKRQGAQPPLPPNFPLWR